MPYKVVPVFVTATDSGIDIQNILNNTEKEGWDLIKDIEFDPQHDGMVGVQIFFIFYKTND